MRSPFGWSLPPGCTARMIDEAAGVDQPCAVCCRPVDDCVCPECPVCGAQGDPACYADPPRVEGHGMRLTREQAVARQEAVVARCREQLSDEQTVLDIVRESEDYGDVLADTADPFK